MSGIMVIFKKKTNTRISKMALDWPVLSLVTFKYSLTLYCPHFHIFAWGEGMGEWVLLVRLTASS
jgi:hypothetical protein